MKKIILSLLCLSLGSLQAAMPTKNTEQLQKELLWEAQNGNLHAVERLITTADIDVNYQNTRGESALMRATLYEHTAIVQALIAAPTIDLNIQDYTFGDTALTIAAFYQRTAIVETLITTPNTNIDINLQNAAGDTALMLAAYHGHMEVVYALTGAGADIYLQNHSGQCPADILIRENRSKTKGTGNYQS